MDSIIKDMRTFGGATTRKSLQQLGHSKRALKAAVDGGLLIRVTRSWVALPDTSPRVIAALSAHGVVGGATALESLEYGSKTPAKPG
ncbi:MAG TPA: hypothetical protein H9830_08650 [Candidatus Agrococcus pullicola]|uniref:Uncharacterized protein n=1 Tax=Candidatus Agrococcus pullicola TaxID=2838429 RepID=A0A9D1YV09_9MICO|nr:hypothetical protein [Candidatus Agrococcus pullicola]